MSYRVYSASVEIDFKSNEALEKVIMEAWNYEAQVYDQEHNLIFDGWLDDDEQNELLEPYGLEVFEYDEYRFLRNIESEIVYVYSWHHNPFEGNSNFKYQILDGITKGDDES